MFVWEEKNPKLDAKNGTPGEPKYVDYFLCCTKPTTRYSIGLGGHGEPAPPPVHHPRDACYDSVVDDPQLSYYSVSSW